MSFLKELKCIVCLIKCSKYLYYAKKALCLVTIIISVATLIKFTCIDISEMVNKIRRSM